MRGDDIADRLTPEEVLEARELLNLTQQELADALHLESKFSKDTVRAWERGRRPVTGPAGVAIRLMVKLHRHNLSRRGKANALAAE